MAEAPSATEAGEGICEADPRGRWEAWGEVTGCGAGAGMDLVAFGLGDGGVVGNQAALSVGEDAGEAEGEDPGWRRGGRGGRG